MSKKLIRRFQTGAKVPESFLVESKGGPSIKSNFSNMYANYSNKIKSISKPMTVGGIGNEQYPAVSTQFNFSAPDPTTLKAAPMPAQEIDTQRLMQGISMAESAGGKLMMNPYSSATGHYGQLFDEIKSLPFMKGITREQFAKDKALQDKVFLMRYNGEIPNMPGIKQSVNDLKNDYSKQIAAKGYSDIELAALVNYLGRQGARQYFGYHLRDGKPLEQAVPHLVAAKNVHPDEYLKKFNSAF